MSLLDLLDGIEIGIIILSIMLFALSMIAFRRTRYTRIVFASAAFILFAMQSFIEYQDDKLNFLPDIETDLFLSSTTLAVLILFFLALVFKNKR